MKLNNATRNSRISPNMLLISKLSFLGMREIQLKVTDNESRLKSMITNKSLENVDMQLTIDDKIQDFLKSAGKFGSIIIRESPSICTNISSKKTRQAQISAPYTMQSVNNISVEFNMKLNTLCSRPRGCTITRKGLCIFTDYRFNNEKLVAINAHGNTEFTLKLSNAYSTFDVEAINDNIVAITTGETYKLCEYFGISFVDFTKSKVIKFIELPGDPYGIKHDGTALICCVEDKDLHVISCKDYSVTTIPNTVVPKYSYVTTHADTILFTNPDKHKIVCCLYDGTPVWEFNNDILRTPCGITVDDKGNIFVVGRVSCNVLIISPDGKQYKQILNKENGLNDPHAIFFDKLRNQLLVTNNSLDAFFYNISFL
ncbi:uncharacterized protein [Mytilus edulis]|uniref:uncharacterized protein n=1 Tax=Mytilus edulis TaxID=6550 RepID=UPI0039EDE937